ncbi:tripartite tricarboxylate transporter TctB family protein [Streptomyces sp. URMC 129]|uniref:tripartite tricarboxylate transporter TctB family protein n=1 Tax=Streptomyces sp. URMC 129 TaxID=3423407 RepID=UPI003F1CF573
MTAAAPVTDGTDARRTVRRPVLAAYGVLSAVGTAFFLLSFPYHWSSPEDGAIGPGAVPRVAGLALALLGLVLIRQEIRVGSTLEGDGLVAEDSGHTPEETRRIRRKLVVVVATMVITTLLIPVLGLLPALSLMALFLAAVVERQPWPRSAAMAAATLAGTYLLFEVLLRIPLPLGIFDPALWSAS